MTRVKLIAAAILAIITVALEVLAARSGISSATGHIAVLTCCVLIAKLLQWWQKVPVGDVSWDPRNHDNLWRWTLKIWSGEATDVLALLLGALVMFSLTALPGETKADPIAFMLGACAFATFHVGILLLFAGLNALQDEEEPSAEEPE